MDPLDAERRRSLGRMPRIRLIVVKIAAWVLSPSNRVQLSERLARPPIATIGQLSRLSWEGTLSSWKLRNNLFRFVIKKKIFNQLTNIFFEKVKVIIKNFFPIFTCL